MATTLGIMRLVILLVVVVLAVALIIIICLQPTESQGLGAISGNTDTFYSKNKSKTLQGLFKKLTIIFSIALAVLTIVFFVLHMDFWYT